MFYVAWLQAEHTRLIFVKKSCGDFKIYKEKGIKKRIVHMSFKFQFVFLYYIGILKIYTRIVGNYISFIALKQKYIPMQKQLLFFTRLSKIYPAH